MCVTRQIITAVKNFSRKKHSPLRNYYAVDVNGSWEDEYNDMSAQLRDDSSDPLQRVIEREEAEQLYSFLKDNLSEMEVGVIKEYLKNKSYKEIAADTGLSEKMVDNALSRVREKLLKASKNIA